MRRFPPAFHPPVSRPPPSSPESPQTTTRTKSAPTLFPIRSSSNNGKPVLDAKTWTTKRRPEIVEMYETQQYGRAPGRPDAESFEITDKGTPALNGKAIRKQVTIYLTADKKHKIDLLIYIPAAAKKPVPLLFGINFGANSNAVDDPGIKPGEVWDPKSRRPAQRFPPQAPAASAISTP